MELVSPVSNNFSQQQLLGQCESHLIALDQHHKIHRGISDDWQRLQQGALQAGINLKIASSFRSFERQLAIWNAKACGNRVVNDRNNKPLDLSNLTRQELVTAILAWSALPGASRHHWGCDLDVYDPDMLGPHKLQLEPWEYQTNGPMAQLGQWLTNNLGHYGFYQPYRQDRGGVAIEPWHISHIALSTQASDLLTETMLKSALTSCEIQLQSEILTQLPHIMSQYVTNIDQPKV